ncbi:WGR domain-containing protein [Limnohabitans sp. 2KL-1]|uniref:WGR domain-containing protein n=1 Tax=Limnohabitans sp. 2KL-1 TaxID=1100699 RepID=UPI001304EA65|nr:WGR domain-containing protein [Limnohabitans sp. 2KL-1]
MSSTSTRTFGFKDDKSSKFWEITQVGSTVTVRYGKAGTNGQIQEKVFNDASAASRHVAKVITEKTGKGYLEVGSAPSAGAEKSAPYGEGRAVEGVAKPLAKTKAPKLANTKPTKPKNPAQDPEATPESLMELLDKDEATNRLLAKHPKASEELLEKLSHSREKAIRQLVVLHPNTPKEALLALAPQFPGDFFKNPAFDWLLLEDPELLFKIGGGVLKNILKRPECPVCFMQWALKRGNEDEQLALAMNPSTPSEIIKTLAQRKGSVGDASRGRAEAKGGTQSDTLDLEQAYIAEVKKALSEVKPDEVLSAWKRDMITSAHWAWLSLDCRVMVSDVHLSMVVASAIRGHEDELAKHSSSNVRALVASYLENAPQLLEALASDTSLYVRAEVASNPYCPDELFKTLVKDKQAAVRAAAAGNVNLSTEQAVALASDSSPMVREAVIAAWRLPREILEVLAQEKNAAIRKSALKRLEELSQQGADPRASSEELSKIAKVAKAATKLLLAANPSTPTEWINLYIMEGNDSLDRALLKNPCLPSDVAELVYRRRFEELHPKWPVFIAQFIWSIRIPLTVLELAAEKSWITQWPESKDWRQDAFEFLCEPRAGVDQSALLLIPEGMEAKFASSALRSARLLGLANPRTPPDVLIKRSNSVDWAERLAIARNTSLPTNLIVKLKKDPHRLVSAQAEITEKAKAQIKDRQAELLAETSTAVDWGSIVQLLQQEIKAKGVRPWEWYGTSWWSHLDLKERLGYLRVEQGYKVLKEPYLEEFFADVSFGFERLIDSKISIVRDWISGFKGTPLKLLEALFDTQKNSVAQRNWLSRVRTDLDPELPEKLRIAAGQTKPSDAKWSGFLDQLMHHPDMPSEGLIQLAHAVEGKSSAQRFLKISSLPQAAQEILAEICNKDEMTEITQWALDLKTDARKRAATHPHVPLSVLEQLIQDKNKQVRLLAEISYFASTQTCDSAERSAKIQILLKQLISQDAEFKREVCRLKNCPAELIEVISKEKNLWPMAQELARNPNTPVSVLIKLAKLERKSDWPFNVHREIIENPVTNKAVLQQLLISKSANLRGAIAWAQQTPSDLLLGFEKDPEATVRVAIAKRQDSPKNVLALLADDTEVSVRLAIAERKDIDIVLREKLAMDQDNDVRYAAFQMGGFSEDFYTRFFEAGGSNLPSSCIKEIFDEKVLNLVAKDLGTHFTGFNQFSLDIILDRPSIPHTVFMALSQFPECRRRIAVHPDIPPELLEELAHDSEERIVSNALQNPIISETLMREVLIKRKNTKFYEIRGNYFAPHDLLDICDKNGGINKYTAKTWYEKKLAGESIADQVKTFLIQTMELAMHPKTPLDRLRSMALSGVWIIRWAVSSNANFPKNEAQAIRDALWHEVQETLFSKPLPFSAESLGEEEIRAALQRLDLMPHADDKKAIASAAKSSHVLSRVAAALNPGIQPSVLKMLLEDTDVNVKALAAEKLRLMESSV